MMPGPGCFSDGELKAFLLGDIPQRVSQAIMTHLEVCTACDARTEQFDTLADAFICSLRQAHLSSAEHASTNPATAAPCQNRSVDEMPAENGAGNAIRVAGYTILEELGRGGMSVVYKARQSRPDRLVALKMILAGGHAGAERRARFLAEADAIGRLQHPGIVQVYEVGEQDGLPFLVLEYLAGGTLADRTRGQPQPLRQAAQMVETVARAVHHAHQQGVIHRDLKPGNILLTSQGQPKVSDFGLAKQERPELTATGAVLGTPSYMAPEQAEGDKRAIGPASDVYALGAILYELLTGRPPFQGATALETLEQVRSQEVVPPIHLQTRIPHDLNTLCLKSLNKEPHRRYATALELADDLRRFLDGKPILARPVHAAERLWRWARRRPAWAAMLLTVGMLILVILIGGSIGLVQLNAALNLARQAERATQEQLFDALLAQAGGNCLSRRPGQRFESLEIVKRAARLARELNLPAERFFQLRNKAILALALPDLYVQETWNGLPDGSAKMDFDEDLAIYAWMDRKGHCEVRRVADEQVLHQFSAPADTPEFDSVPNLSPDGKFLALRWLCAPKSLGYKLHLFRLTGEKNEGPMLQDKNVREIGFDKAGRRVVLGYIDGSVSVHELRPTQPPTLQRRFPASPFKTDAIAALHPTEPWVAVISYFGPNVVEIRDWLKGVVIKTLELPDSAGDVAWHPDGHTLAVAAGDGPDVWLYESATWNRIRTLHGIESGNRIIFNPKGDRLAGLAWGGGVHLFDVGTGKLLFHTLTTWGRLVQPRFSRDGRRLACSSDGKQLGIWEVGDAREYRTFLYKGEGIKSFGDVIDVWTDNRLVLTPSHNSLHFFDMETGQEIGEFPAEGYEPGRAQFVPGGPQSPGAVIMEMAAGLYRLPIQQDEQNPGTLRIGPPQLLSPIHFYLSDHSRDGLLMAGASRTIPPYSRYAGGWVLRADRPGAPVRRLEEGRDIVYVALSPRGDLAVTSPQHVGVNRVWDVASGRHLTDLGSGSGTFPRFSPDAKWLSVSGDTGALYTVGTWEKGLEFNGVAQFSPDSRQLAVSTKKGYLRLIDVRQGRDLAWFEEPNQELIGFHRFSPDGTRLITISSGSEGGIHVWDLRAIRRQLKALDLDWEAPEYPPEPRPTQTPLRLKILPGPSGE